MSHVRNRGRVVFAASISVLAISVAGTPALAQLAAADVQPSDASAVSQTQPQADLIATTPLTDVAIVKPKPKVIKTWTVRPKRSVTKVKRFTPWAQPTYRQVHKLIDAEARRWGAPGWRLRCRVKGESTYNWAAQNGQYAGLLQFGSETFQRGLRTARSRVFKVKGPRTTYLKYVKQYRQWDDGRVTSRKVRKVRVTKQVIYRGKAPRNPARTHGAMQVRIGAQAMAGISAVKDSEWEVRC